MNQANKRNLLTTGFSLMEMLVVIGIFAVISIVVTQSLFVSFRESKKSDAVALVRESLDYALGVIERNLYNAQKITACTNQSIAYRDEFNSTPNFSCIDIATGGNPGYISSNSARLTSSNVDIFYCNISCVTPTPGIPPTYQIDLVGSSVGISGVEFATFSASRRILIRSYY